MTDSFTFAGSVLHENLFAHRIVEVRPVDNHDNHVRDRAARIASVDVVIWCNRRREAARDVYEHVTCAVDFDGAAVEAIFSLQTLELFFDLDHRRHHPL